MYRNDVQIMHLSRDTEVDGYPQFYHYKLIWNKHIGFKIEHIPIPKISGLLCVLGSGKKEFETDIVSIKMGQIQTRVEMFFSVLQIL